ncbi:MAG: hypothetical protein ABI333_01900 [bacterium]
MSDALVIAIVATGIAALIIGAVTWMLVLPARAARLQRRVLPEHDPPLEFVERLLELSESLPERSAQDHPTLDSDALLRERGALLEQGRVEAARRVAQVLCVLTDPSPEIEAQARTPPSPPAELRAVEPDRWISQLASPALERPLTAIMALLGPEVITWHAHPADRFGLTQERRAEYLSVPPPIALLAPQVAQAVSVSPPVLFVTPEREGRLIHINLAVAGRYHAALAVGRQALAIDDDATQRFMLGRKLTYMRPEHLLCTEVDGPDDLLALHRAVAAVLSPGTLEEPPEVVCGIPVDEALARLRERFSTAELAALMRQVLTAAGPEVGLERWARWLVAAEETSFRCGLLMSGDLQAAMTILHLEDVKPGTDREREQCYNALYGFYVSEPYEALRQSL